MHVISTAPKLVAQVREAVIGEIASGRLRPGDRLIQEQIALELGVSRQPVQQALLLLRNEGVARDAPGRGLVVAPVEPALVRNLYDLRAVMEGLAFRRASEFNAQRARRLGPVIIARGQDAIESGSIPALVAADLEFHQFIHELSRNPLIGSTLQTQWTYTQRVMGEVLMRDLPPRRIWAEHEELLEAVMSGDGDAAERLARRHVLDAAEALLARLCAAPACQPSAADRNTEFTADRHALRVLQSEAMRPFLAPHPTAEARQENDGRRA